MPMTQSLVGGLAPLSINNDQLGVAPILSNKFITASSGINQQPLTAAGNRTSKSRNSQIKQYSSLGAPGNP